MRAKASSNSVAWILGRRNKSGFAQASWVIGRVQPVQPCVAGQSTETGRIIVYTTTRADASWMLKLWMDSLV